MKKKYIWWTLLLLVFAGVGYGYLEFSRTRGSVQGQSPKFVVNATDLLKEFGADESKANLKYQGVNIVMQVSGLVKNIETDERGLKTVLLGDTSDMSSVRCAIDSLYTSEVAGYTRGSRVALKGYLNGYKADETGLLGSDIEMNGCAPLKSKE